MSALCHPSLGVEYLTRAKARLEAHMANGRITAEALHYQTVVFTCHSGGKLTPIIASSDHFQQYLARRGLSPLDIDRVDRILLKKNGNVYSTAVVFRSWDVFTWFLDIDSIDLCGQILNITYGSSVSEGAFTNSLRQNINRLDETRFWQNHECVNEFLPLGSKKDAPSEAVSTKVFTWGDKHGSEPHLWRGLGEGRAVVQASCGDNHMAFLTEMGQVITSGECLQGQVGNGPSCETVESYQVKMPGNLAVRQIACGNTYTLALSESNNVFYWGTCKFAVPSGPYNVPKMVTLFKTNTPTLWDTLKQSNITQIASGAAHILLLRSDGIVLSVGAPDSGRLGRTGSPITPLPVAGLQDLTVSKIGCGYSNSLVFAQGRVYVWGRNDKLQCGIENTPYVQLPTELPELSKVKVLDVSCGFDASYAVTSDGAYRWGSTAPMKFAPPDSVVFTQFAVGKRHTLARGPNGELYSWGDSHLGQCGHGDQFTYPLPTRIYGVPPNISGIAACGYMSLAFAGVLRSPLSEDFEKCVNNPKSFPDIAFQVGSSLIYAHRAMIVARCHELKIMHLLLDNEGAGTQTPSDLPEIQLSNTSIKRTKWPSNFIPNQPSPVTSQISAGDDSQPNSEVIIVPYNQTLSGAPITENGLRGILRYIYTDALSDFALGDVPQARALASDFGLPRYTELMAPTGKLDLFPSTFNYDVDCLVQTPPEDQVDPISPLFIRDYFNLKQNMSSIVGAFADLSLTVSESGAVIPAHRFILCARSSFFATLLTGGMLEATSRAVTLQTDESTCRWLLRFIYSDRPCSSDINITVELLKASAMINLERLVYLCSRAIEKELDLETTAYMYHLTSEHSIKILKDICWDLLIQDFEGLKKTNYWNDNLTEEDRVAWIAQYDKLRLP